MANAEFDTLKLARRYAQRHYTTDAALQEVFYLPTNAPEREIRLVEVNGSIAERSAPLEPIDFGVDIGADEGHTLIAMNDYQQLWWDERAVERPRIVATPGICGGSARVNGTRIPVWGLEVGRRIGRSDKNLLRAYPSLTAADLEAAWRYVDAHREQIEAEIRENDGP